MGYSGTRRRVCGRGGWRESGAKQWAQNDVLCLWKLYGKNASAFRTAFGADEDCAVLLVDHISGKI